MSPAEAMFRINGEEYPLPMIDTFTLPETVLVNQVTTLSLEEFVEDQTETRVIGFAAVALMRGNPDWGVQRTLETLAQMHNGSIVIVPGQEVPADPVPPPSAPDGTSTDGANNGSQDPSTGADESEGQPAASSA